MVRVRRMLTEVLLEVTNEEIESVASEVYMKARRRISKGTLSTTLSTTFSCRFVKPYFDCTMQKTLPVSQVIDSQQCG